MKYVIEVYNKRLGTYESVETNHYQHDKTGNFLRYETSYGYKAVNVSNVQSIMELNKNREEHPGAML